MKLRITDNAIDNLEEILFYLEFIKYSPDSAKRAKTKIIQKIKKNILIHPHSYRECEEIITKTKIYRKVHNDYIKLLDYENTQYQVMKLF